MKHLFIINPAAGQYDHTVEFTKKIAACYRPKGIDYEIQITAYKGHCVELARAAARTGEEYRIYACGGDGTLNGVVRGVIGYPNVAVTHLPGGSGNDFIRIFSDVEAFRKPENFLEPEEAAFDLIKIGDLSYSVNICSMGVDARVCVDQGKWKRLPGVSGHQAYNLSLVGNVIKGVHRGYEVEIDGKTVCGHQTLIAICNGRFYGGGYNPVPEALPDDGYLDVLLVKQVSRLTLAKVIGQFKEGRYKELPDIITHYRVKELTIHSTEDNVINADGECFTGSDVHFSVAPEKLRFFYPRGLTYK